VRCKTCHYSLDGLTEHRCPECGTPFDPNDPSTFAPSARERLPTASLLLLLLLVSMIAVLAIGWPLFVVVSKWLTPPGRVTAISTVVECSPADSSGGPPLR
jgi:hypothetical protein